jgi:hypothetical protein
MNVSHYRSAVLEWKTRMCTDETFHNTGPANSRRLSWTSEALQTPHRTHGVF